MEKNSKGIISICDFIKEQMKEQYGVDGLITMDEESIYFYTYTKNGNKHIKLPDLLSFMKLCDFLNEKNQLSVQMKLKKE